MNAADKIAENYYFRLVCVDEQNPLGYTVLEDVSIDNMEDVHKYVIEHLYRHTPELTKWLLIPFRKDDVSLK